jgi:hypothetical protein
VLVEAVEDLLELDRVGFEVVLEKFFRELLEADVVDEISLGGGIGGEFMGGTCQITELTF